MAISRLGLVLDPVKRQKEEDTLMFQTDQSWQPWAHPYLPQEFWAGTSHERVGGIRYEALSLKVERNDLWNIASLLHGGRTIGSDGQIAPVPDTSLDPPVILPLAINVKGILTPSGFLYVRPGPDVIKRVEKQLELYSHNVIPSDDDNWDIMISKNLPRSAKDLILLDAIRIQLFSGRGLMCLCGPEWSGAEQCEWGPLMDKVYAGALSEEGRSHLRPQVCSIYRR